jgi:hypothetical protein
MEVPDEFRGRVFAAELALVTVTSSVSSYVTGWYLDHGASPRAVSLVLGAMFFVPGTLWLLILSRWRPAREHAVTLEDEAPPSHSAPVA